MKAIKLTLPDELKEKFTQEVAKRENSTRAQRRVLRQFVRFYIQGGRLPELKR